MLSEARRPAWRLHCGLIGAELGSLSRTHPCRYSRGSRYNNTAGSLAGVFLDHHWLTELNSLGRHLRYATELRPFFMGIVISVFMGMFLTLPISSAAIAIILGLSGLSAGAATAGCAAQMIGFRRHQLQGQRHKRPLGPGSGHVYAPDA
ncbi:hypothetical protein MASR2M48_13900 [Spirochaetota bacterium]